MKFTVKSFLLCLVIFVACTSKDNNIDIKEQKIIFDTLSFRIPLGGKTFYIDKYKNQTKYNISNLPAWLKIDFDKIKSIFKIRVDENITNTYRNYNFHIKTDNLNLLINISQEAVIYISKPTNNSDFVTRRNLNLSWKLLNGVDAAKVYYKVGIGISKEDIVYSEPIQDSIWTLKDALGMRTKYYWRVEAFVDDLLIGYSNLSYFTTGDKYYNDKEVRIIEKNKSGKAASFVILGDGFTIDDYEPNGIFDKVLERAVYGLFKAEPFSTYRKNFNVYNVVAYSRDKGVTEGNHRKNTIFQTYVFAGNSSKVEANYKTVQDYAHYVKEISDWENTVILLVVNKDKYCGSTVFNSAGPSPIAMVGLSNRENTDMYWRKFENVVTHETCGHGFGRLADEYLSGGRNRDFDRKLLIDFRNIGQFMNVEIENDHRKVSWKHFIGRKGYDAVSVFEGALTYPTGFYRSEKNSCMLNNTFYFNAISREEIVKRIMNAIGEEYSLEKFIEKDKIRKEPEHGGVVD